MKCKESERVINHHGIAVQTKSKGMFEEFKERMGEFYFLTLNMVANTQYNFIIYYRKQ